MKTYPKVTVELIRLATKNKIIRNEIKELFGFDWKKPTLQFYIYLEKNQLLLLFFNHISSKSLSEIYYTKYEGIS